MNTYTPPGETGQQPSTVTSPCGGITVTVTAEGLPVDLDIAQNQLAVSLDVLAARIVALCALAAGSHRYRQRLALAEAGTDAEVLDALGLPGRADLLALEETVERWCPARQPSEVRR